MKINSGQLAFIERLQEILQKSNKKPQDAAARLSAYSARFSEGYSFGLGCPPLRAPHGLPYS
jgi:hypothetical protein